MVKMDSMLLHDDQPGNSNPGSLKSQLECQMESLEKYLTLPWDNLENFIDAVKVHEAQFKEHLQEEIVKQEHDIGKLTPTQFYIRNAFHIFNFPIADISEIRAKVNLSKMTNPALALLNRKGFSDLKDWENLHPYNINTHAFLQELTTRLFNLNFSFPKLVQNREKGSMSVTSRYLELLPGLDNMEFKTADLDQIGFIKCRFELYYYFLNPKIIFGNPKVTALFEKFETVSVEEIKLQDIHLEDLRIEDLGPGLPNDRKEKRVEINEQRIQDYLFLRLEPFLSKVFCTAVFPISGFANRLRLRVESQKSFGSELTAEKPISGNIPNGNLTVFDQTFEKISGRPNLTIKLHGSAVSANKLDEHTHTLCFFEIKNRDNLIELAKAYVSEKDFCDTNPGTTGVIDSSQLNLPDFFSYKNKGISVNEGSDSGGDINKTKLTDADTRKQFEAESNNGIDAALQFHNYLLQIVAYCKLYNSPVCCITNGFDLIIIRVIDFYDIGSDTPNPNSKEVNLFRNWEVTMFEGDNCNYSLATVLCSLILDESKCFLKHQAQLSGVQLKNYHLTYGSSDCKKALDKMRYLISRKVFYQLITTSSLELDNISQIKFDWQGDIELEKYDIDLKSIYHVISEVVSSIADSTEWKEITKMEKLNKDAAYLTESENRAKLSILDSSLFKVIEILQNESWCTSVGATTMKCSFQDQSGLVLKTFDVNRMPHTHDMSIEFKDGTTTPADFQTILKISLELFLKEVQVYQRLGKQSYLPELINYGFIYNPSIKSSSLGKDLDLYENYLIRTNRTLRTEAPFILLEHIEMVSVKDIVSIDFEELEKQAFLDLGQIHINGIIVGDICHRNIIIKKTGFKSYRVIFLDFGQSKVSVQQGDKSYKISARAKSADRTELHEAIDYFRGCALRYKELMNKRGIKT